MFWLSHHPPEEFDRCYRIGGFHVCARCLGTYPTMFVTIAVQIALRAPITSPLDLPLVLALTLPATLDWAVGRFNPQRFSNPWRTFTGVLLGLGLGRSLFTHLHTPFPPVLLWQGGLVILIGLPVVLLSYGRKGSS